MYVWLAIRAPKGFSRVRASVHVHGSHDITQRSKANAVYRWLAFALWLGVLDAAALLTFDARRLARRRLLLGTLAALGERIATLWPLLGGFRSVVVDVKSAWLGLCCLPSLGVLTLAILLGVLMLGGLALLISSAL